MPDNLTTYSIPHDPEATARYWQDRAICVPQTAPEAVAPEPDVDEPDEPQQAELPSGPTHVAARRSPDQLASARKFIAAAGRVKFDRGRATLKAVWMSVAYYASLGAGPERVCFASLKTLSKQALVSKRTARRHLATLAAHGLIQTDHRTGGHAPNHWAVPELSPSVCGGQNVRGGRTECPGGADKVAAEVSNRSSAPTGQELLASKQQPDGACAPPAATEKNPPHETKREQTLAPVNTDTGGVTRGGVTDKQIGFLKVLADRVGADHAEDLWREADPKRLQAQIKAAIPFKDLKVKHTHAALTEVIFRVGMTNAIANREGVQRCECGAVRAAIILNRAGETDEFFPWTLSGHLVDYLFECTKLIGPLTDQELAEYDDCELEALDGRWADPMTFSEVRALYETAPKMSEERAKEMRGWGMSALVGDCLVEVPSDWNSR